MLWSSLFAGPQLILVGPGFDVDLECRVKGLLGEVWGVGPMIISWHTALPRCAFWWPNLWDTMKSYPLPCHKECHLPITAALPLWSASFSLWHRHAVSPPSKSGLPRKAVRFLLQDTNWNLWVNLQMYFQSVELLRKSWYLNSKLIILGKVEAKSYFIPCSRIN